MSTSEHVSALLHQLVQTILPPSGAHSTERAQQAAYMGDLAHRLLKGGPRTHVDTIDERAVMRHAEKEIARRTGGPAGIHQALQFQQLHRKLVAQSSAAESAGVAPLMSQRPKLLYLLQAMQGEEAAAQASAAFASHFNDTQHMVPAQQAQQRPAAPQDQQVAAYTPPAAAAAAPTSLTSSLAAQQSAKLLLSHSSSSLSESELLRDLLFTLLGANGNYVQFNPKLDAFLVLPSVQLSNELRTLVQRIAELGWLYRKISNYVAQVMEGEQSPSTGGGARSNGSTPSSVLSRKQSQSQQPTHEHAGKIEQSFGATLRDELNDYIRLVTLLETQVETANAESAAASQAVVAAASASASAPAPAPAHSTSAFTLRRMWVWVQNPLRHLGLLAMLVDESRGITGGCLASHLGRYLNHGDPFVVALVKRVMRKTCVPLFEMIHRWVCTGSLADPYGEFFVRANPGVSAERLWADKYALRREMVPTTFLPSRTVHRILGIGKAVNFLKTNCKKAGFKTELDVDWNQMFQHGTDLSAFNSSIDVCFTLVNSALVSCLHVDYHFGSHALALKKYMMAAQGDFHQLLLDSMHRELEKPARETSTTALMGMLEQAKRGSSARFEREEILHRLSLKKISAPTVVSASSPTVAGAEVGYDVFTLLYTLSDSPLSVIFTAAALEHYQTLFNFLLRLKRVEGQLNATWAKQTKLGHSIKLIQLSKLLTPRDGSGGGAGSGSHMNNTLDPLLKQCNGLRHEMLHFLTNTHSYLMFEVLESAWEEFIKKINPVKPAAAVSAAAATATAAGGATSSRHERTASTAAMVPVATGVAAPPSAPSAATIASSPTFAFAGSPAAASASASASAAAALKDAPKPLDLEGLIKAHKVFLQQIMDKALLGGDSQPLLPQLLSLFQLILSFCAFTDRLYDFLGNEIERRETQQAQHARQKSGAAAAGGWGASALAAVKSAPDASILLCIQSLTGFLREFQRLAHDFSGQFRAFLRALKLSNNSEAADKIGGTAAAGKGGAATMGTPSKASSQSMGSSEWDADDDVLDRSDSMMSPLPLARTSSASAAAAAAAAGSSSSSSGQSAAARAQRHASNLHELDFLRFRLDFNEYYRANKEAHRRRQAAYEKQQAAMAPKPALTSAQINQQRAAAAAATSNPPGRFVNPKAWEE